MTPSNISVNFLALWRRALQLQSLGDLTTEMIESWAEQRRLTVIEVKEKDVGAFGKTNSIVLTVEGGRACFPKIPPLGDPTWELLRQKAERDAILWRKMEWFAPLWIPNGKAQLMLSEAEHRPKKQAIDLFNYHTSTLYTLSFQAVCIAQIMPQARSLQEFCPLAREAYLAFYSGYKASSISALIPLIEGALTRIVSGQMANSSIAEKVDHAIGVAIKNAANIHFDHMWVPSEYLNAKYLFGLDERIFVFETFRSWLLDSFFSPTGQYDGGTWLNRHLFAHATTPHWQQTANFSRLVVALATLGVIESWYDSSDQVSLFFPSMNEDSTILWQQALFQAEAQFILKIIEEKRYHDHGRLVPEMPEDNGVLLRKALLSDECIKDLVRPLRDAGWSVEISEPDKDALYMTVVASSDQEQFGIALLYSCATDNAIYKKLAETSSVILYRGAPYHQEQFAYGLDSNVHVGPVTGWQPPLAPNRH